MPRPKAKRLPTIKRRPPRILAASLQKASLTSRRLRAGFSPKSSVA
eukprot:CAMPEP_0180473474 /NCGR_PEP_ID=MMETSP1036_2-20121128/30174_1 /TAXON_ID=632150 /ORGANISM="Azadinium spinosum, Strain 3D9" /LENGTH=45 /DNA_ID= /DNA_START= /DNA_END= /DNA_ORIENTATION=